MMAFLIAVATLDMAQPVTMGSLYVWVGGLFVSLLGVLLAIGKWFLTNQITGQINKIDTKLDNLFVEVKVMAEHIRGFEATCNVRHSDKK